MLAGGGDGKRLKKIQNFCIKICFISSFVFFGQGPILQNILSSIVARSDLSKILTQSKHNSVDSSLPSILWAQVQILSTPSHIIQV